MEQTLLKEAASHGTASWLLTNAMFLLGVVALLVATVQTDNPWVWVGLVFFLFAEAIDRRRLSDPDDPRPSWWPWT